MLTSSSTTGLGQGGQVLGLAVAVGMRPVGGPAGDADREEREQRGDEVGARVQRLGDEPEAAAREARAELDPHQRHRGADRDESGTSLRAHRAQRTARSGIYSPGETGERRRAPRIPTAISSPPTICTTSIVSPSRTTAKSAATNGCRFVASVAREAPIRSSDRNQRMFVIDERPERREQRAAPRPPSRAASPASASAAGRRARSRPTRAAARRR